VCYLNHFLTAFLQFAIRSNFRFQGHIVCSVPHSSVSASCSSAFGLTPTTPEFVAPELSLMMQIRDSVRLPAGVIRTV